MTRRNVLATMLASVSLRSATPNVPLNWIVLSLTGEIYAASWPDAERAVSVGSLLKPFLAAAYLRTNTHCPIIDCQGATTGCWKLQGHGRQDLVAALANSCNAYFLRLATDLNRAALDLICLSYGLSPPPRAWLPARLIGLAQGWPQEPVSVARAFGSLARNSGEPGIETVLTGMARCSQSGTARAAGFPCFAKTGTARCSHLYKACGDGYALAMYPLHQPRCVVLVMRHNTTGANAAYSLKPAIGSSGFSTG